MKIGRNESCPCGSGKKYKKCCIEKDETAFYHHSMSGIKFDKSGNQISLYERNMSLIYGIIDIFHFDKKKSWTDIKREISRDHVKELYKLVTWLWPPDTDISVILPKPENKLRSLYLGWMRPESVLDSVVRYSLYCDQILVMNPFLNPWCISEEANPLLHPEEHIYDTIKWVLFVLQLAPWIQDKHVILIPDPGDFDYQLRIDIWNLAKERAKNYSIKDIEKDPQLKKYSESDFKRVWMATPTDVMKEKLKNHYPKMVNDEVEKMIQYIEKEKERDPFFPTNPNETGMFGFHTSQTGGNLEMGLFLSQATGSYLYTDFDFRWKEILSIADCSDGQRSIWEPLTHAFQKLDFKFLNPDKITPDFANRVRQDGRLESMRNFLRRTWLSVSESSDGNEMSADDVLNFTDELTEEYNKAEVEWKKIDMDLLKWVMGRGGVSSILAAGMNWQVPALGFSITAVEKLLNSRFQRDRFRKNVPMSVFVDLRRKR